MCASMTRTRRTPLSPPLYAATASTASSRPFYQERKVRAARLPIALMSTRPDEDTFQLFVAFNILPQQYRVSRPVFGFAGYAREGKMSMKRSLVFGTIVLAILGAFKFRPQLFEPRGEVEAAGGAQAPMFEVDPMWPKPLPNHWILGATIGVSVDAQDHIWVVHRQGSLEKKETYLEWTPVAGDCCAAAP